MRHDWFWRRGTAESRVLGGGKKEKKREEREKETRGETLPSPSSPVESPLRTCGIPVLPLGPRPSSQRRGGCRGQRGRGAFPSRDGTGRRQHARYGSGSLLPAGPSAWFLITVLVPGQHSQVSINLWFPAAIVRLLINNRDHDKMHVLSAIIRPCIYLFFVWFFSPGVCRGLLWQLNWAPPPNCGELATKKH
jgi:hypothetical protein